MCGRDGGRDDVRVVGEVVRALEGWSAEVGGER